MEQIVTLTPAEVMNAAIVGVMREVQNQERGRKDAHGLGEHSDGKGWQYHIEGACGEAAFAKSRDAWWSGSLGHLRANDVGKFEVRTRSRLDYELIVHPGDPDNRRFVLVVGQAPTFHIKGWMNGAAAKRPEWWKTHVKGRPAFFVPQENLEDMETLDLPW